MMVFPEPDRWLNVLVLSAAMLIVVRFARRLNRPTYVPIPEPVEHTELREDRLESLMIVIGLTSAEKRAEPLINARFDLLIQKRKWG